MTTTKTALELTPGDVVQTEQGPSRVTSTTPDGDAVAIDFKTVAKRIGWGDSFPAEYTFELIEEN
ncbi:hypothetical protein ACTJJ4_07525 [Microbacterium sp. 22195]|uniref:hypothetical protein n=1 Tax=Microbacterium sp. 22195 TaxID=3453891 RepID=UPI003F860038